jgi:hypothetical protein
MYLTVVSVSVFILYISYIDVISEEEMHVTCMTGIQNRQGRPGRDCIDTNISC